MEYTGCSYQGEMVGERMDGKGTFLFVNGNRFEGEIKDGMFHGEGVLHFPSGTMYKAVWKNGKATQGQIIYEDGLQFEKTNWDYCKDPDRRFYREVVHGLKPGGSTSIAPHNFQIPSGCYDVGDGYWKPEDGQVYEYSGEFRRNLEENEEDWIRANCRKA
eukprot:GCRY01002749.1.p1 GENE.GCRY01002749.1~~GCRY01002749.1.p1  ORF type:complete len:160 (+),score=15.06 GCRY01002749.1:233-712(+)